MQKIPRHQASTKIGLSEALQFLFLPVMQSVVGSRVASLVVLEFSLRTMSAESSRFLQQLLVQCSLVFSLGCALSCGLHFLHEGAPQLRLCLLLAAELSWFLGAYDSMSWHCTDYTVYCVTVEFWTPLTICYTLLVVYMQGERLNIQKLMIIIFYSWGRLMVLMLIVGRWADVVHIILCFLGEASCLIPSRDLLDATTQDMEEVTSYHILRGVRTRGDA
ncbi:transmembrane protein 82-like [Oncorhynchus mykiss]|uniref:transmembrane protein 82-like n=1 Tax=Oncorhynchus mykiss TaxID=8022 RepID=UPI0018781C50|nr:transmembrane protein 82-like [Oncorhynchus mykiss]